MDKSALASMPETGIRLNLSNYWRIRTWQGGGEFWEHHNQQLIRDSLGQFLPRATVESGNTVLYQLFERGKELCSLSEPVTPKNPIPNDQAEQLRAALISFKAKASDPNCDPDSRKLIDCFRLPDPKKDPELYRVVGSGRNRHLIVLWGAEKEQDSAIPPLEAVNMVHAEPSVNSKSGRPMLLAAVAIIVAAAAAYYFMGGGSKNPALSDVVTKPGPDGRLVVVSPESGSLGSPAGIGSVEKPDGSSVPGPNGSPLAVGGVTDAEGKPVLAANGEPLKVGLLSSSDGKPETKNDSGPLVTAPVTGSDGKPLRGSDGAPTMIGFVTGSVSDESIDGKRYVVGADDKPVMGPDGKPVEAGLLTGPDGKPVVGTDGKQKAVGLISGSDNKPVAIGPVTDPEGKPMTSTDQKPVAIGLGNNSSTEKPDDKTPSKSAVHIAAAEAKPEEAAPFRTPVEGASDEGRKDDLQKAQPDKAEQLPGLSRLPVATDPEGKPMTSTDNKPEGIGFRNNSSAEKPDDKTSSKSTGLIAADGANPEEAAPSLHPGGSASAGGRKADPQKVEPDKADQSPGSSQSPVAKTSTETTKMVGTKIPSPAGGLTFRAEEIPEKGQNGGKIAVKLLPLLGDSSRKATSATWTINGAAPSSKVVIEESAEALTMWLAPGTHRIALKAQDASGNNLEAEAELDVQIKTQVELKTRSASGNP